MKFSNHPLTRLFLIGTSFFIATVSQAQETPSILIDSIHAHNSLKQEAGVDPFSYHHVYGYGRAFDYLREHGVKVDEATTGKIDSAALAGRKLLFINLVSANLPPFRLDEINAIKSFVEDGGSLFVITDHSNCYFHAYKLMPLLEQLDINVTTETACDMAPFTMGTGNGWISIRNFAPHPVTENLKFIGIQTGGTVDDRFGIAKTSPKSWGDEWASSPYGDTGSAGNYGNWKRDTNERSGPLSVLLAKEVGKGRVFIAADQNMFGDSFLNYADNYKLWLNAVSWLLDKKELKDPKPFQSWRGRRVVAYEGPERCTFGADNRDGYFNVFGDLGRKQWIFASNDLTDPADLILFADDYPRLSEANLTGLVEHLKARKNVILFGKSNAFNGGEPRMLEQLQVKLGEPGREAEGGNQTLSWEGMGQLLIMSDARQFNNSKLPPPESKPTAEQEKLLDGLNLLIEGAMEKE